MPEDLTVDELETPEDPTTPDPEENPGDTSLEEETPESYPASVVQKLRDENAKFRQRARQSDDLAQRLHLELVRGTGRLADPADLEFSEDHLSDPEAMAAAIDDLIESKPHLRSRTPRGDIGLGAKGNGDEPVNLINLLRGKR